MKRSLIFQLCFLLVLFIALIVSTSYIYSVLKKEQYESSFLLFRRLCNRKRVETLQQFYGGMTILQALNLFKRSNTPTAAQWAATAKELISITEWKVSSFTELRYFRNASKESPVPVIPVSHTGKPFRVSDSVVIVNTYETEPLRSVIGLDYFTEKTRYEMVQRAIRTRDIQIAQIVTVDAFRSLVFFSPTFIRNQFVGGVAGLYRENVIIPDQKLENIHFRLIVNNVTLLKDAAFVAETTSTTLFVQLPLHVKNLNIEFGCSTARAFSITPEIVLGLCLFLSISIPAIALYAVRQIETNKRRNAERVQHEQEVTRAKLSEQAALQTAALKSAFLANVSHEIRTPLNGITGMTEILMQSDLSKSQQEYLDIIRSCSASLLSVVNDVLDYSKAESDKILLEVIPCNPAHLISNVINMFIQKNIERGNRVEFHPDANNTIWCKTDPARLQQVIANLMSNATKFTENGVITFGMEVRGQRIVFYISDTGVGMSEEQMSRLFLPFSQADASITRQYGGTGLGLAISRKLIRLIGGDIEVRSKPREGTTFTFYIPYEPCPAPEAPKPTREKFPYDEYRQFAEGKSILVVDDSKVNLKVASMMLQKLGYVTFMANDGQEAVNLFADMGEKNMHLSAILMDIQMPNMDGYTATRVLREKGVTIPIIAMTANALSGERERCIAQGLTDYLTKPVEISHLAKMLQQVIDDNAKRDTGKKLESGQ